MQNIRPDQPTVAKDFVGWDADHRDWNYGELRDRVVAMPLVRLWWENIGAGCLDERPGEDIWIDVEFCESIYIQCSTVDPDTAGANTDFNVETSPDTVNWDTVPFATINLGAQAIASMLVQPGMKAIRMRLDNNGQARVDAWAIIKRLK